MVGMMRCLFWPHEPHRRRVHKLAGEVYVGFCTHCGAPIRRRHRNDWVRDWKRTVMLEGFRGTITDKGAEADFTED